MSDLEIEKLVNDDDYTEHVNEHVLEVKKILDDWVNNNFDLLTKLELVKLEEDMFRVTVIDLMDTSVIMFAPLEGEITKENITFMPFANEFECEAYFEELLIDNGIMEY